ncbi:unnamed protein product [Meloidogyne enterolobii]|uniref:Uncharacterized protein n=1 Tax=Meloidogyne enterolobii TaxID=390850 RepID=A0ACB0ZES6_MELEN
MAFYWKNNGISVILKPLSFRLQCPPLYYSLIIFINSINKLQQFFINYFLNLQC